MKEQIRELPPIDFEVCGELLEEIEARLLDYAHKRNLTSPKIQLWRQELPEAVLSWIDAQERLERNIVVLLQTEGKSWNTAKVDAYLETNAWVDLGGTRFWENRSIGTFPASKVHKYFESAYLAVPSPIHGLENVYSADRLNDVFGREVVQK